MGLNVVTSDHRGIMGSFGFTVDSLLCSLPKGKCEAAASVRALGLGTIGCVREATTSHADDKQHYRLDSPKILLQLTTGSKSCGFPRAGHGGLRVFSKAGDSLAYMARVGRELVPTHPLRYIGMAASAIVCVVKAWFLDWGRV